MAYSPPPADWRLREGTLDAEAIVASFLLFAQETNPDMLFGGHKACEVFEAFCHIIGVPPAKLRERMLKVG